MLSDDLRYRVLKALETNPGLSQRELAAEVGISLGKVNYCVRALIDKGAVKVSNFRRSDNKRAYLYKLTPWGITEKARLTRRFLHKKLAERDELEREIDELRLEVETASRQ